MGYKCVYQQEETDCGAACLSAVFLQYGKKVSPTAIRKLACTDLQGTNALGLTVAAKEYGFKAATVKADEESLKKSAIFPCIADVLIEGKADHYVVIHRIKGNKLTISDPAIGRLVLSMDEFCGRKEKKSVGLKYAWKGHLILLAPDETFVPDKHIRLETPDLLKELLKLKKQARPLVSVMALTALVNIGFLCSLSIFNQDGVAGFLDKNKYTATVIVLLFLLLGKVLSFFNKFCEERFLKEADLNSVHKTYEKMLELPLPFFEVRSKGDTVLRLTDGFKVGEGLTRMISVIFSDIPPALAGMIVIGTRSLWLLLAAAVFGALYIAGTLFFEKRNKRVKLLAARENSKVTANIYETLAGVAEIKLHRMKKKASSDFLKKLNDYLKRELGLFRQKEIQAEIKGIVEIAGNAVFIFMAAGIFDINTEFDKLVVCSAAFFLCQRAIKNIGGGLEPMKTASLALERIRDINESAPENIHKGLTVYKNESHKAASVELKNVSFRYGMRKTVFKNVNLYIKSGESVAIVGENGSGKTTLVKLLMGLYQPTEGSIFLDGKNIGEMDLDVLRQRIGYVSQTPYLFYGSVYDNIVMGGENIPDETVLRATMIAGCHEFIMGLQNGYQTILGENAVNLSGGQRQKIAIARALVQTPDLLIIDEGTSQLDTKSAEAVLRLLDKEICPATKIIITHESKLARLCDRVVRISGGGLTHLAEQVSEKVN